MLPLDHWNPSWHSQWNDPKVLIQSSNGSAQYIISIRPHSSISVTKNIIFQVTKLYHINSNNLSTLQSNGFSVPMLNIRGTLCFHMASSSPCWLSWSRDFYKASSVCTIIMTAVSVIHSLRSGVLTFWRTGEGEKVQRLGGKVEKFNDYCGNSVSFPGTRGA